MGSVVHNLSLRYHEYIKLACEHKEYVICKNKNINMLFSKFFLILYNISNKIFLKPTTCGHVCMRNDGESYLCLLTLKPS